MIFIHRDIFWNTHPYQYARYMQALSRVGFEPEKISVNGRIKKVATREQIENAISLIDNNRKGNRSSRQTLAEVKSILTSYLE